MSFRSSLQCVRNSRTRSRLSIVLAAVIIAAALLNSAAFTGVVESAPEHHSTSKQNSNTGGKHKVRVAAPAHTEEIINQSQWMHTIARGHTIDMYALTQANDCKRLPSWRANEKRFIRLQADRSKPVHCMRSAALNHTQLFGLRTVSDTTPVSHHHYRVYEHDKDTLPEDEPRWMRLARKYVSEKYAANKDNHQEGASSPPVIDLENEALRVFSLISVVTSENFLWVGSGDDASVTSQPMLATIEDLITSKRLRLSMDAHFKGRLEINPDMFDECAFSKIKPLSHVDLDPFSLEGYRLVQFLFEETFLRHGWVTLPVAGTGLGTLRHHGMFRGDDDMDMTTYPAARYLLQESDWGAMYDDFDTIVEEYGTQHEGFTWFRSNDYRTHRPWFTRNDKKKKLPAFKFQEYEDHVRQNDRVCFAQYMTWNGTEKRRLFQTEGCTPNHWFMCLQPSTYLYDRHNELLERHIIQDVKDIFNEDNDLLQKDLDSIGPMIFTAFHRRPAGKLCKCKFGYYSNDKKDGDTHAVGGGDPQPSFGICPSNLPDLVQYWYDGKWCIPSGAVRTRKWSFLKSWND